MLTRAVLPWAAHVVIQDNIHMLRSGQRGVDMWHAHLKE